jgi:hypothetical protein
MTPESSGLHGAKQEHLIRSYLYRVQRRSDQFATWESCPSLVRTRPPGAGSCSPGWLPSWLPGTASLHLGCGATQPGCQALLSGRIAQHRPARGNRGHDLRRSRRSGSPRSGTDRARLVPNGTSLTSRPAVGKSAVGCWLLRPGSVSVVGAAGAALTGRGYCLATGNVCPLPRVRPIAAPCSVIAADSNSHPHGPARPVSRCDHPRCESVTDQ